MAITYITALATADAESVLHFLKDKRTPKFYYQSVYFRTWYFLVRIRFAKCFTKSSGLLRCEVISDNGYAFCSRPKNQGDLESAVTREVGRMIYYTGLDVFLILFL